MDVGEKEPLIFTLLKHMNGTTEYAVEYSKDIEKRFHAIELERFTKMIISHAKKEGYGVASAKQEE
jgi:hypothetical protein